MINYVKGDATKPIGSGMKIIPHIVNSSGLWGSGFVVAIEKKWPKSAKAYRQWYRETYYDPTPEGLLWEGGDTNVEVDSAVDFMLGNIQAVQVEEDIIVANMIAQKHVGFQEFHLTTCDKPIKIPPIRYDSLEECMWRVAELADKHNATIHAPKFGSERAGGDWEDIVDYIEGCWAKKGIITTIYEFEGQ